MKSTSDIVLGLTRKGARFEGARSEARAVLGRSYKIALDYCIRVTQRAEDPARAKAGVGRRRVHRLPPRPRDGIFSKEMLAGLSIGPHEGKSSRVVGRPRYEALGVWTANKVLRRMSRQIFPDEEILRWQREMGFVDGGRVQRWHLVEPKRKRALNAAVLEALRIEDMFSERRPDEVLYQEWLKNPPKPFKVRDGQLFADLTASVPISLKGLKACIKRLVRVGPPTSATPRVKAR